jgi:Tol biopolymer transport system component
MRRVRITHAPGADILPAFSADGKYLIWTSQRAGKAAGEQRPASQLWVARWRGVVFE